MTGTEMRNKWENWYEAHLSRWIPAYAFFPLIGCFLWNCLIYWGTQQIILGLGLQVHDITSALDRMVPFRPVWVSVYVLSYPFWVVSYALTARESSREDWFRFVFADMLSRLICGIIFLAYPTTNVRPDILGDGFWDTLMGLIYSLDPPLNLFPSIHCLESWFCFRGALYLKKPPRWYPWLSLVMTLLVCASTVLVKQHLAVDIPSALLVAELGLWLSRRLDAGRALRALNRRLRLDE